MKAILKVTLGAILLTVCVFDCRAQTNTCTLTSGQLPEVRGFKLGMTFTELKNHHPNLPAGVADVYGYAVIDISESYLHEYLRAQDAEGLDGVRLAFLDGKLVKFRITYSGLTRWNDTDEFLKVLIANLKLPAAPAWQVIDPATRQLDCDGNSIQVKLEPAQSRFENQGPSVAFVLNNVDNVLAERKRSREARQHERLNASAPTHPGSNALTVEAYLTADTGDIPATGVNLFLLDADPLKLFHEEDVRLTRFLSEGEEQDEALISEFFLSLPVAGMRSVGGGSEYLKRYYTSAMAALKPHIVQSVITDAAGKASFSPVGAGTYYLIGGAEPPAYAVWKVKVDLTAPQITVKLDRRNTMAGLRTRESDEEHERQRRQEDEKRRRTFKP